MTPEDLTAIARTACRAIVELMGPGKIVATVRKAEPGLLTRHVSFTPGEENEAIPEYAKAVKAHGIRRFMVQSAPEIPGTPIAVVTEDGVSVRAVAHTTMGGQEWVRLSVWGRG